MPDDWLIVNDNNVRPINPIAYTDCNEQFTVKITSDELASLKDDKGHVRFMNVFEWCLPRFVNADHSISSLWEWQAC